jgi:hypothetical protein
MADKRRRSLDYRLPLLCNNGGNFPTNYDIQGFASQIGPKMARSWKISEPVTSARQPEPEPTIFNVCPHCREPN